VQTATKGYFSGSDQDTKTVYYKAVFAGDSSYAPSESNVVTVTIQ